MKALAMAVAILIAGTAFGQTKDQQNYCTYIEEQAAAQRDLQQLPTLSAGVTPSNGTAPQIVWGVSDSVNSIRKGSLTYSVAKKQCELYTDTTDAQLRIQFDLSNLDAEALNHKLTLISDSISRLDLLIADTRKKVDAQNATWMALYPLEKNRDTLVAQRQQTLAMVALIHVPDRITAEPLSTLIPAVQAENLNVQKAQNKLVKLSGWDISATAGVERPLNPLPAQQGTVTPFLGGTATYSLGSHSANKHLDQSLAAFNAWKLEQQGDLVQGTVILHQLAVATLASDDESLVALQDRMLTLNGRIASMAAMDSDSAITFGNQLKSDRELLVVNQRDLEFRIARLREYISKNF